MIRIKDGFVLRKVADNYLVVAVGGAVKDFNGIINLNETGAFLWEILAKGATEEETVKKLTEEYDVTEETAKADVAKFIEKLKSANLLK